MLTCIAAEPNGKHTQNGSTEEAEAGGGDAEGAGKKKKNKKSKGPFSSCRLNHLSQRPSWVFLHMGSLVCTCSCPSWTIACVLPSGGGKDELSTRSTLPFLRCLLHVALCCLTRVADSVSRKVLKRFATAAGKKPTAQTEPPSIPVAEVFPDGQFPEGEWQSYKDE